MACLGEDWDKAMLAHAAAASPLRDATRFAQNPEALGAAHTPRSPLAARPRSARPAHLQADHGPLLVELGYANDDVVRRRTDCASERVLSFHIRRAVFSRMRIEADRPVLEVFEVERDSLAHVLDVHRFAAQPVDLGGARMPGRPCAAACSR